jgi:hypothetical protein
MNVVTCMLADGARVASDGKLYIYGGRWDRLFTATVPVVHPTMAIVLVLELDWNEAFVDHVLDVALHDADGTALGPRAVANLRVGHGPDMLEGDPVFVPVAIDQQMVKFQGFGRYEWTITWDNAVVGHLPITVARLPNVPLTGFPPGVQLPAPRPPDDAG